MKQIALAALIAAAPLAVTAQQDSPSEMEEGFSLMEEGAKLLFRGLMDELEPTLDDLSGMADEIEPALEMLASELGPALMEIMRTIDSVRYYEAPEILPNGDIIIRRSEDAPPYVAPEPEVGEDGAVDL